MSIFRRNNICFLVSFALWLVTSSLSAQSGAIEKWLEETKESISISKQKRDSLENLISKKKSELGLRYFFHVYRINQLTWIKDIWEESLQESVGDSVLLANELDELIDYMDNTLGYKRVGNIESNKINVDSFEILFEFKGVYKDIEPNRIFLSKMPGLPVIMEFRISNSPEELVEFYVNQLTLYRRIDQVYYGNNMDTTGVYIDSGETFYKVERDGSGGITIHILDNPEDTETTYEIIAERVSEHAVVVTPWTSLTDIHLNKGDTLTISAHGELNTSFTAEGIAGKFIDARFPYGSLIGKIGPGNWFLIGSGKKSVIASDSGQLTLRINSRAQKSSDGYFIVVMNKEADFRP